MNFTFGIISNIHDINDEYDRGIGNKTLKKDEALKIIIDSIRKQNIPNYEIIFVGYCPFEGDDIIKIEFNDDDKLSGWITKKKNLITKNAKYDNIVYMHDYLVLEDNWYSGFKMFGDDFDVCMTKILNKDGARYRDWTLWAEDCDTIFKNKQRRCIIPYDVTHLTKFMYVSGAYWIAKKDFMLKHPLDENIKQGESEDVKWSKEIRNIFTYQMNQNSSVKLLKWKHKIFDYSGPREIEILKNYEI